MSNKSDRSRYVQDECVRRTALRMVSVLSLAAFVAMPIAAQVSFTDASATSFVPPFVHNSNVPNGDGMGGAAWLDYDRDGLLDLFLTNGQGSRNALYRNTGAGSFIDVAGPAGVANGLGNAAVVAADLDNDGDQDLFLTGDGGMMGIGDSPLRLYRNNLVPTGIATFTDVTAASGLTNPLSHMDATFGDIDNDGYLDLFIAASGSFCLLGPSPACTPGNHRNRLYRNTFATTGALTFQNITAGSGVGTALGACTAFFGHYDNDRSIDLFVGNCNGLALPWPVNPIAAPNELFRNNGNNTFTNVASAATGFNTPGFWMGFGQADFNNDLLTDLFTTNAGGGAPHAFWVKTGTLNPLPPPTYFDAAPIVGVTGLEFAWGTTAQDFDLDGYADLYMAGALPQFGIIGPGLGNPGRLLINQLGLGIIPFSDITATLPATANLAGQFASGVASADYDNDGDVDLVVQTDVFGGTGGAPLLLNNQGSAAGNNSLTVCVRGTTSNRDGVGARIAVGNGSFNQLREIYAGNGYLSMDSQWKTFGLGAATSTSILAVWWPNGAVEIFPNVAANQQVLLVEGSGIVQPGC